MTNEIPDDAKRWTAKRRQVPDYHDQALGQTLDKSCRWLAEKGALQQYATGYDMLWWRSHLSRCTPGLLVPANFASQT